MSALIDVAAEEELRLLPTKRPSAASLQEQSGLFKHQGILGAFCFFPER
jgi:hypothetical protein